MRTQFVEYLGGQVHLADTPSPGGDVRQGELVVVLTIRPEPNRTWEPANLVLSLVQAKRLHDNLGTLLRLNPVQFAYEINGEDADCPENSVDT